MGVGCCAVIRHKTAVGFVIVIIIAIIIVILIIIIIIIQIERYLLCVCVFAKFTVYVLRFYLECLERLEWSVV